MEEQKRNPAAGLSESEQVQVRRQKLADLQAAGHDPFTLTKFPQDAYSADLKEEFKDLPNETDSGKKAALAGRMMSKRVMGKASFAHLRDDKGDIQLYVRRDELGEESYAAFKKLDVGDIIGVKGEVFRTKTGELSVRAEELTLLAKSLRPLPEKFHGLTDTETRYRQRYVDLIANPEVKETFVKRSQILKEIRAYLDEKGFLEVDTPILTPFEIGASARPFYTHHNTLNMDMVLRIETELYLKRLIVGGMDRVYEVGRIFRNEGMDPKHNPEFTTIELYQAFTDFHGMMDLVEELYKRLALKICGGMVIPYQGKQIDMGHWERLTMIEAVKKYSGVDFNDWKTDEDAIAFAKMAIDSNHQLLCHCNGDAAADQLLRVYEAARDASDNPEKMALRPVMIHAQTARTDQYEKMAEIGMIPSIFSSHVWYWGDAHLRNLGSVRGGRVSACGDAERAGLPFTLHTDTPVLRPNLLEAAWCAVNRITKVGVQLDEDQKVTPYEAMRAITYNGAYQYSEEADKGTLEEGKLADLVVLDRNPLAVDPREIRDIQVLATIKEGETLYERDAK